MIRPTPDRYFVGMAYLVAERSTCLRRRVGCVLVNARNHVLATGYNGNAAGMPHCNEESVEYVAGPSAPKWLLEPGVDLSEHDDVYLRANGISVDRSYPNACPGACAPSGAALDACEAIHAEQNALLQCRDAYEITTAYSTTAPCVTCVKLLMNTSCRRIVFVEDYPHAEAAQRLWIIGGTRREWVRFDG